MNTSYIVKTSISKNFNRVLLTVTRIDTFESLPTIVQTVYNGVIERDVAALILKMKGFECYTYKNQFYGITRVYTAKF